MRKWDEDMTNRTKIDEQIRNVTGFVGGEECGDGALVPDLSIWVHGESVHHDRSPEGEAKFDSDELMFVHTALLRFL